MNEGVHKLCPKCGKELVWRPYFHRWVCYNKECDYISEVCGEGEEVPESKYDVNEALKNCGTLKDVKINDVVVWKYPYDKSISQEALIGIYDSICGMFPENAVVGVPEVSDIEIKDRENAILYLEAQIQELRRLKD